MFTPLPDKPDHDALELELLDAWERERTFAQLREQNASGPRFSFVDGPVTANRMVLGVHTAWGRTLKDVFQRYKALRGYDQRYQNGFDCQGLWVEVEVEKSLGLNSKRDIEEYGLAEFAARCRERVAEFAEVITDQDRRDRVARTAPLGPEVDDDWCLGLQDFLLEGLLGDVKCHETHCFLSCVSFANCLVFERRRRRNPSLD